MFKKLRNAAMRSVFIIAVMGGLTVNAQTGQKLRIGDQAPELKYSKWIKGTPLKSFSGDQLYVMEFWATWCSPCKAAMPGLTKLAKEYAGKAIFIGANVWERPKENQNYESVLPAVTNFVEGNKVNMGYEVVADNNEQHLGNNWLKAAGINGIPATFVIKNNKIIWIGHPVLLDSMMNVFLSGKYNMQDYSAKYYKAEASSIGQQMKEITEPISDQIKNKEYAKALEMTERALTNNLMIRRVLTRMKFQMLLRTNEPSAIKHAESMLKDNPLDGGVLSMDINEVNGLSPSSYSYGATLAENAIAAQKVLYNPQAYEIVASLYAKANDYNKAVLNQQKAIDALKAFPKEKLPPGVSVENNIEEMKSKLKTFENGLKK